MCSERIIWWAKSWELGKYLCISSTAADVQLSSRAKPMCIVMVELSAFAWKNEFSPTGWNVKQKVFFRLTIIFVNENSLSLFRPLPSLIFSIAPFYDQILTSERLLFHEATGSHSWLYWLSKVGKHSKSNGDKQPSAMLYN